MTDKITTSKEERTKAPQVANKNLAKGVIFMLVGGLGFSLMNLFVRKMGGDIPSIQKTFFRNIFVFIFTLIPLLRLDKTQRWPIKNRADLAYTILRSMFGTLGLLANFVAVDLMPIANASVLNKLSPFFTIIFAAIFLREKVNLAQVIGLITAFIGVVILAQPEAGGFQAEFLIPVLIGIAGGLFAGAAYTTVRYLGTRGIRGAFIVTFFAGFASIVLLPFVLMNYKPMSSEQWLYAILIGICAVLGQYGITYAYQYAEPRKISIFDYSTVVFTMILGMVFLGQIPTAYSLLGSIIIFLALFLMFIYNYVQAKKTKKNVS